MSVGVAKLAEDAIYWSRAIILIDMDAFFASIEQLDHPAWRARPVVITNGDQGSCIITCSYEARAFGIKTGMRLTDAQRLCPELIRVPSRPQRYAQVSQKIMQALTQITPDIEVFSVDEAFLDVTHCQRLHGGALACAKKTKQLVFDVSGLHCSVGLSSDKTSAKYAAKLQKPNGLSVIYPQDVAKRLAAVEVSDLCGIGPKITQFLARYAAYTCADVRKLPMSILSRRFGNQGRRLWLMCHGKDPEPVRTQIAPVKSMGHGKVLPPNTYDNKLVLSYFLHMCYKLAARLRRHQLQTQQLQISFRTKHRWITQRMHLLYPSANAQVFYQQAKTMFMQQGSAAGVFQVQVTALNPLPQQSQIDLLSTPQQRQQRQKRSQLAATEDAINQRYGSLSLAPASLIQHAQQVGVISPAWKASGPRQSIELGVREKE